MTDPKAECRSNIREALFKLTQFAEGSEEWRAACCDLVQYLNESQTLGMVVEFHPESQ